MPKRSLKDPCLAVASFPSVVAIALQTHWAKCWQPARRARQERLKRERLSSSRVARFSGCGDVLWQQGSNRLKTRINQARTYGGNRFKHTQNLRKQCGTHQIHVVSHEPMSSNLGWGPAERQAGHVDSPTDEQEKEKRAIKSNSRRKRRKSQLRLQATPHSQHN